MDTSQSHLYRQFHAVFDTYYNSLCNYAYTFTRNADSSEDIVQELFTKIWEDRRELVMQETIRYYLFTAVRNNCITILRQEKNAVTVEWKEQEVGYESEPYQDEEEADHRLLLAKGIDRLPPKCRDTFVLSRFGKMTYKEIAANQGVSVKTVENQLGKALKMLRTFLKDNGVYLAWAMVNFILSGDRG
jgi:RNA polymerase sigma-70 factor (family 1)